MAGCTSKVLFVFVLLVVSACADIVNRPDESKREDDGSIVVEVDDVNLNTNRKYSMGKHSPSPPSKKNKKGKGAGKSGERHWKNEDDDDDDDIPVIIIPFVEPAEPINPSKSGEFIGKWELVTANAGVSAMHAVLIPKLNKVLMYDATIWKLSQIQLTQEQRPCRIVDNQTDCWAHAVFFDYTTGISKPLKLTTDTWCSSGGLTVDGNLVSTGGDKGGSSTVRYLTACENCDWKEYPNTLAEPRWYGTQVTLADGSFVVAGGRESFSYEFIPPQGQVNKKATFFPFLKETKNVLLGTRRGEFILENNLYPFLHLAPDGNIFFFANNRSVLLDPRNNKIIREYPVLEGGPRNYPTSGSSALLPIKIDHKDPKNPVVEVLICGGAVYDAYYITDELKQKPFPPALKDCARMDITSANPVWKREDMPSPRVMGDMMILPSGDILLINGATRGSSGWNDAADPNLIPVLYNPDAPYGQRFKELIASTIPRMYHSTSTVLPDGKVLISGSNTNNGYLFKPNVEFSTELRVEKFSPPYLAPEFDDLRPEIVFESSDSVTTYGRSLTVTVKAKRGFMTKNEVDVTIYSPAFTTHGVNMNQRLIVLDVTDVLSTSAGSQMIFAMAPLSGTIAPPGYYLLSVVYKGIPSKLSMWIQIK